MYNFFVQFHSGIRWLILLAAIIVVVKSLIGLFAGSNYSKFDKIVAISFTMFMRVQFVLGVVLYFFLSPYTSKFTFNMSDATERFWSVEHILLMFLAIGAAEMGSKISGKSDDAQVKFKFQAIFFGISLLLILVGIPWGRI
ncbi:MAG: cytochrome B [Cyclobacteriaceae bacterium]